MRSSKIYTGAGGYSLLQQEIMRDSITYDLLAANDNVFDLDMISGTFKILKEYATDSKFNSYALLSVDSVDNKIIFTYTWK